MTRIIRYYRHRELIRKITALQQLNTHLQSLVSDHGQDVPADILKAVSDLDWLIRTGDMRLEIGS